jgi:hypothetical protein
MKDVPEGQASEFVEFVRELNEIARSVIVEDGVHDAMYFLLLPDGSVSTKQFAGVDRPVGDAYEQELAAAVTRTGADAVVFVSEAWSADPDTIPDGAGAGDAPGADNVLIVAAADRQGTEIVIETPVLSAPDGTVQLGQSEEYPDDEYRVRTLDAVRRSWRQGRS